MATVDTTHATEMPSEAVKDPSTLNDADLYFWLKENFKLDYDHCDPWHKQAREDFGFKANHQWEDKTKAQMQDQGAGPPIVFNMSMAVISAVAGIEINQRHDVTYLPRGTDEGQIKANEVLSGTSQWMGDECDAEDEESEAFEEALDCGLGCTENRMDYDTDPDGMYVEEKCNILEMYWDKNARKKNLIDAKRIWRARRMPLSEARYFVSSLGIEADDEDLDCKFASPNKSDTKAPQDVDERRMKLDKGDVPDTRTEVTLLHAQWIDYETFHRVVIKGTNKEHHLNPDQFKALGKRFKDDMGVELDDVATHATQRRKVYWEAFLGGSVLLKRRLEKTTRGDDGQVTNASLNSFTYQFITGYLDKTTGYFHGLITILRDPQKLINKTLQKMIHVLSTTAQGGILAEEGAFGSDLAEAQKNYARYDVITQVKAGAIANNKIMPKPGGGNVSPFAQLLEYAIEALWRVVGLNPEIMGMAQNDQPGVLEMQRKQAAMTILAKIFDSLRRFRKNVGKCRLYYIQNFISDGRIVRINGKDGWQGVKLMRDNAVGKFDVIVDDAPTSPNQKELTFSILLQLLQMPELQTKIDAETLMIFLEYSPLPSKVVDRFRQKFSQPNPEQEQQKALAQRAEFAKIKKDEAGAARDQAAGAKSQAEANAIQTDPTTARTNALSGIADVIAKAHNAAGAMHKANAARTQHALVRAKGVQGIVHAERDQALEHTLATHEHMITQALRAHKGQAQIEAIANPTPTGE